MNPRTLMRGSALAALALAVLVAASAASRADLPPQAHAQNGVPRAWTLTETRLPTYDAGALYDPRGVAAGPGGEFYVADTGHDRIAVVDAGGTVVRAFGEPGYELGRFLEPTDVAVDGDRGRVYVTDYANRRLVVLGLDGSPIEEWLVAGPDVAFVPSAVDVGPTGDVYVVSGKNGRVERFGSDGTWYGGWGVEGSEPGDLRNPGGIAVLPDGRVVVADAGNARLQIFSSIGNFELMREVTGVRDVAAHPSDGHIYALHNSDGSFGDRDQVTIFDANLVSVLDDELRHDMLPSFEVSFKPAQGLAVGADGVVALSVGAGGVRGLHGLRQYARQAPEPWELSAATAASPTEFGGFQKAKAIEASDDGTLHVLESALRDTKRYAPDGAFIDRLGSAWGHELTVGPDGSVYVAATEHDVMVRKIAPTGMEAWVSLCDCLSGMGLSVTGERVYATSAFTRSLVVFQDDPADPRPIQSIPYPEPEAYVWPLDVDTGPDGRVYAAGGELGTITVLNGASGAEERIWRLGDLAGAERISVAPDGTVFALHFDGSLSAWDATGAAAGRSWRPEPVAGYPVVMPVDIAAGPGGRVYVLDDVSGAILVYDAGDDLSTPTPPPVPDPPCTVTGDKIATPNQVALDEEVTIALQLDLKCQAGREPQSEIMMIIDRSNSMAGPNLDAARSAARSFATNPTLDLGRNRVGLVSFSDIVSLDLALSDDVDEITAAIDAVNYSGSTELAKSMRRATYHVEALGRPEASPVMLLLTDGRPNRDGQPYVDAYVEGARARARGAVVYTIGLGTNIAVDLLTAMAGSLNRFFAAPTPGELAPIYEELSRTVGGVVASDVEVTDVLGDDVEFVPGSANRGGLYNTATRTMRWSIGALQSGIVELSFRVRPITTGTIPTNKEAIARYVADGDSYQFTFPVPEITVYAPPTPTPVPEAIYLPITMVNVCVKQDPRIGADVMLAIDTSSSMQGEKMASAIAAARQFVGLVDPSRDWVGLVSFDAESRLEHRLTADVASVDATLAGLQTGNGTRIDKGLQEAVREIGFRARPGSQRVIILLSDGRPSHDEARQNAQRIAESAKRDGVTLFAIGLGADTDGPFLEGMASVRSYFYAPTPADLEEIYRRLVRSIPCD